MGIEERKKKENIHVRISLHALQYEVIQPLDALFFLLRKASFELVLPVLSKLVPRPESKKSSLSSSSSASRAVVRS
jgi:hypothetical protein